jgi:hypothetical protein
MEPSSLTLISLSDIYIALLNLSLTPHPALHFQPLEPLEELLLGDTVLLFGGASCLNRVLLAHSFRDDLWGIDDGCRKLMFESGVCELVVRRREHEINDE